ncbi:MAG: hypothetical protein HN337_04615 [Deltaproteobacteria bacterium]|jgi:hypothetical protein|nr:hypothetical protein [Deltaproteobacteria bacterium]
MFKVNLLQNCVVGARVATAQMSVAGVSPPIVPTVCPSSLYTSTIGSVGVSPTSATLANTAMVMRKIFYTGADPKRLFISDQFMDAAERPDQVRVHINGFGNHLNALIVDGSTMPVQALDRKFSHFGSQDVSVLFPETLVGDAGCLKPLMYVALRKLSDDILFIDLIERDLDLPGRAFLKPFIDRLADEAIKSGYRCIMQMNFNEGLARHYSEAHGFNPLEIMTPASLRAIEPLWAFMGEPPSHVYYNLKILRVVDSQALTIDIDDIDGHCDVYDYRDSLYMELSVLFYISTLLRNYGFSPNSRNSARDLLESPEEIDITDCEPLGPWSQIMRIAETVGVIGGEEGRERTFKVLREGASLYRIMKGLGDMFWQYL